MRRQRRSGRHVAGLAGARKDAPTIPATIARPSRAYEVEKELI